jgi:hypothetical protein
LECDGFEERKMSEKKEGSVKEGFYVSVVRVSKVDGLHRRAELPGGTFIDLGVHGPIKTHYGLEDQPNLPLPVDYLVAAAAG